MDVDVIGSERQGSDPAFTFKFTSNHVLWPGFGWWFDFEIDRALAVFRSASRGARVDAFLQVRPAALGAATSTEKPFGLRAGAVPRPSARST